MEPLYDIDHVDIVTCHLCNRHCKHCIDSFLDSHSGTIESGLVETFLRMVNEYDPSPGKSMLLLGGEPTVLRPNELVRLSDIAHANGYESMMSTNGILRRRIVQVIGSFDWVQVTMDGDDDIDFWSGYGDRVNAKVAGDGDFTMRDFEHFLDATDGRFGRRSLSMYFTPDFRELCTDQDLWRLLDSLDWTRNGSYLYAFYEGCRVKRCIPGETNVIDEPTIPKLYPNGNYNRTWRDEELDDYLTDGRWREIVRESSLVGASV